ncbi:MAG: DUF3015 family protein [Campylobacterales bacterium]|nr:DUF3015 family protein [Campylobacterales bacterium]
MKKILMNLVVVMAFSTLAMADVDATVNERAKEFIASNLVILAKEAAVGHGESIETLAELLSIRDVDKFSAYLQTNHKDIKNIGTILTASMVEEFNNISTIDMQLSIN